MLRLCVCVALLVLNINAQAGSYTNAREANEEKITGTRSVSAKIGLISVGAEYSYKEKDAQDSLFVSFQTEGFLLVGYWDFFLIGKKHYFENSSYVKLAAGWYMTENFVNQKRYGPMVNAVFGWEWESSEDSFWGIELGGFGLAYLWPSYSLSGFLNVPSVYWGKHF